MEFEPTIIFQQKVQALKMCVETNEKIEVKVYPFFVQVS